MTEEAGSNTVAGGQLRALVERIERIETEIKGLNSDKSDLYQEAKGTGFCVKTLRKVVALRRKDDATRQEEQSMLDLYLASLGMDD